MNQKQEPAAPVAANDNNWDGRTVKAWPTGKRLTKAKRYKDLKVLIGYREMLDMANGTPANDNWREPPPPPGETETRAAGEIIDNVDKVLNERSISPSIDELKKAAALAENGPTKQSVVVRRERRTGKARAELGGLVFVDGARLLEFKTEAGGEWKKPRVKPVHHRGKKTCDPDLIPNTSGAWSMEEIIDAKQNVRAIHKKIPESSARLIELALGSTTAQELGEAFGKRGKTAERFGVRLFDRAIEHLATASCP